MESPTETLSSSSTANGDGGGGEMEIERREDRLSNLPDPIIHHILSFLDMRYVIPTSLLSRKWRYLWTFLPFLTFDREEFLHSLASISTGSLFRDFTHFVNRVLLFRQSLTIQSFRLYWGYGFCNSSNIDSWLRTVILRHVQELDIQIATKKRHVRVRDIQIATKMHYFELPESIYTCSSLTSLHLDLGLGYDSPRIIIPMPDSINLPLLRSLSLRSIDCLSNKFLDLYFSGCPVLETLSFSACDIRDPHLDDPKSLTFSAHQLKHLVIDIFNKGSPSHYSYKILISAPNLTSFTCTDYITHDYSLENLSSLLVANIQMERVEPDYDSEADGPAFTKEDANRMGKFLRALYNVKSLTLNSKFLEVVSEAPDVLRRSPILFSNLTYLKLVAWIGKVYLRAIMYLLENCRNIETLVLEIIPTEDTAIDIAEYWGEELSLQHLKVIQVWNIEESCDNELDFLKTVLKTAPQLEKMTVFISKEWLSTSKEFLEDFREELLTCPRASSDVTILFLESQYAHGDL